LRAGSFSQPYWQSHEGNENERSTTARLAAGPGDWPGRSFYGGQRLRTDAHARRRLGSDEHAPASNRDADIGATYEHLYPSAGNRDPNVNTAPPNPYVGPADRDADAPAAYGHAHTHADPQRRQLHRLPH
jgi:hypothetical protein